MGRNSFGWIEVLMWTGGLLSLAGILDAATAAQETDETGRDAAGEFAGLSDNLVKKADGLIGQLHDKDWDRREEAMRGLMDLYPQAVFYIRKVAESVTEPEAKERLQKVIEQSYEGLFVRPLPKGWPVSLTPEKLKHLSAIAAPNARVAHSPASKLLVIACDDPKYQGAVKTLLTFLGLGDELQDQREAPEPPAWEQRLRERLSQQVSFDFNNTPLLESLTFLANQGSIALVLDGEVDQKAEAAQPTRLKMTKISLGIALNRVCRSAGLVCQLQEEFVFISDAGWEADLGACISEYDRYEINEGVRAYHLPHKFREGLTATKLKELCAAEVPEARMAHDAEMKFLVIACEDQEQLRRVEALVEAPLAGTEATRELKVLVIACDEQERKKPVEALLNTLGETGEGAVRNPQR